MKKKGPGISHAAFSVGSILKNNLYVTYFQTDLKWESGFYEILQTQMA